MVRKQIHTVKLKQYSYNMKTEVKSAKRDKNAQKFFDLVTSDLSFLL